MIDDYSKSIHLDQDYSDAGGNIYYEDLDVISIGVLLDAKEQLNKYSETLHKVNYNDYLLDYLFQYSHDKLIQPITSELIFSNYTSYKFLKKITQSEKAVAEAMMKEYLDEYFYTKENLRDRYNSHKNDDTLYRGYWSFEAAAITKIMGLDDSSYINSPYYPKDMLHGDPPGYTYELPKEPTPSPTPHQSEKKKKWWQF